MIKMNNAMLDMFMHQNLSESRACVAFFVGTIPTKQELNSFLATGQSDAKNLKDWKTWISLREGTTLCAELSMENTTDINFRTREQIVIPFAGDPTEMQLHLGEVGSAVPTWAVVHVIDRNAYQADGYYDRWDTDMSYISIVCSVGATGSGADIEIVDGEFTDGNAYKLNNLVLNLGEQ